MRKIILGLFTVLLLTSSLNANNKIMSKEEFMKIIMQHEQEKKNAITKTKKEQEKTKALKKIRKALEKCTKKDY